MTPESGKPAITPRELTIILDAAQGLSIKETAAKYGIAPKTVENHRCRILKKTGCANMTQVVYMQRLLGGIA